MLEKEAAVRATRRRRLALFGPAFVAAIAYVDPGNFATNIAGGAAHGYVLLWVILLANLIGIVLPPVGLVVAIVLLWNRMVGPVELAILAAGYLLAGVGITVGYHRLFTHRSFRTHGAVRYAFAILGQFAVEGNVVSWVANHRKHHQFSDRDGDPHSPNAGYGDGFVGGLRGLWHAQTGWLFDKDATGDARWRACRPRTR